MEEVRDIDASLSNLSMTNNNSPTKKLKHVNVTACHHPNTYTYTPMNNMSMIANYHNDNNNKEEEEEDRNDDDASVNSLVEFVTEYVQHVNHHPNIINNNNNINNISMNNRINKFDDSMTMSPIVAVSHNHIDGNVNANVDGLSTPSLPNHNHNNYYNRNHPIIAVNHHNTINDDKSMTHSGTFSSSDDAANHSSDHDDNDCNFDNMTTPRNCSNNRNTVSSYEVKTPEEDEDEVESEEDRQARELAESEELARQLMAEEAMASYAMSQDYLREHADQFTSEDLAALQAVMEEEDPNNLEHYSDQEEEEESRELSYDTLLRIGERLGDVKTERWALKAVQEIAKLPTFLFEEGMDELKDQNDTTDKCLVCQEQYVPRKDRLRLLPCSHVFHIECVDQWLETKDYCPYCRQCIICDEE